MKKNALFSAIAALPSFMADAILHGGSSNAKCNFKFPNTSIIVE